MTARGVSHGIGLTARTAIGAAAVFIPFVVALVVLSLQFFQRQYVDGIGHHQDLLARHVGADVDQRVRAAVQTLERIAESTEPSLLADPAAGQRFLDERVTLHLLFDLGLSLVSNEGRVRVDSPVVQGGRGRSLPAGGPWAEVARTGRPALSEPYSAGGPGGVAVTLAVPVRDGAGAVVGQLHGALHVDGPNLLGDVKSSRIGKSGYFVVLSRDRVRIIHPDPALVLEPLPKGANAGADRAIDGGFEGLTRTANSAGIPLLVSAVHLPFTGWFLFANLPADEVNAPFRAVRPLYLAGVAIGAVALVLAVWLSLRRVTRPLVQMTSAVERIAERPEPGKRIGVVGDGEVGRLAASFDQLLAALDARAEQQHSAEEARRVLEAQLQQQQRLESLGVLAGGVAHDFNNLLTPIIANASLALQDLPPDHPLRADMEEIVIAARRGADLARRVLAFGQRQVLATRVVELGSELRALEKTLRGVVGERIDLRVEPPPVPAQVRVDPTQLHKMLVALATNSREAMPSGGRVTISVALPALEETRGRMAGRLPDGRYAVIEVADTGPGMDEQTRARIFEPFFTTKGRARSTGLGLAAVHGIVRQHGGDIDVETAPGRGTAFRLYLPIAERVTASDARDAKREEPAPAAAGLRILLVEDEPTVCALASRILRRAGHVVTVAASPGEALGLPDQPRPDLLVSDVLLPEMNGVELHRRLGQRWPGLRALFMSGYAEGDSRLEDALATGCRFLPKPFGPAELLEKVREASGGVT